MTISFQVLGQPGRDNALLVKVDTGQQLTRLLFDCGDGCPHALAFHELIAVDHLFFSHLHMDHVGGFDAYFRANHDRIAKPNHVWGPAETTSIIQHRFQGFRWNLISDAEPVDWLVHEIRPDRLLTMRFLLREAFRVQHDEGVAPRDRVVASGPGFAVEAHLMDHGCPSVAYVVREPERVNVNAPAMAAKGLMPGPWVKRLRGPKALPGEVVEINGVAHDLAVLQSELLVTTPGDSLAYLTDFRMDTAAQEYLAEHIRGVGTVVCESQYVAADRELAIRNMHMAADEVAAMAAKASVGRLILFHLSDRYQPGGWRELLAEGRAIFPNTDFPEGWSV